MNSVRVPPDIAPIFFAGVLVNLDGRVATIQRVAASALRTGNPIILARLYAVVVGLETRALETLERLTTE
jgi:hypothetical protein